jgi:hypothetical protein
MKQLLFFVLVFVNFSLKAQFVPFRVGDYYALADTNSKFYSQPIYTKLEGLNSTHQVFSFSRKSPVTDSTFSERDKLWYYQNKITNGIIVNGKEFIQSCDFDDFIYYIGAFTLARSTGFFFSENNSYIRKNLNNGGYTSIIKKDLPDNKWKFFKYRNWCTIFNLKGENVFPDAYKKIVSADFIGYKEMNAKLSKENMHFSYVLLYLESFDGTFSVAQYNVEKGMVDKWFFKDVFKLEDLAKKKRFSKKNNPDFKVRKNNYDSDSSYYIIKTKNGFEISGHSSATIIDEIKSESRDGDVIVREDDMGVEMEMPASLTSKESVSVNVSLRLMTLPEKKNQIYYLAKFTQFISKRVLVKTDTTIIDSSKNFTDFVIGISSQEYHLKDTFLQVVSFAIKKGHPFKLYNNLKHGYLANNFDSIRIFITGDKLPKFLVKQKNKYSIINLDGTNLFKEEFDSIAFNCYSCIDDSRDKNLMIYPHGTLIKPFKNGKVRLADVDNFKYYSEWLNEIMSFRTNISYYDVPELIWYRKDSEKYGYFKIFNDKFVEQHSCIWKYKPLEITTLFNQSSKFNKTEYLTFKDENGRIFYGLPSGKIFYKNK